VKTGFVNRLIALTVVSFLIIAAFARADAIGKETGDGKRPVTVKDAIEMTRSVDELRNQPIAHYSPDGQKFVAILRRGNLEQNTNDFSMLLWRTNEVFNSPAPEVLVTLSSSSNRDAIEDANWLSDNETVAFLGERPGELHQLYTFNIRTHTLQEITNHPTNLISYSMSSRGDQIAYTAEAPTKGIFDERAKREGFVVSKQVLGDLLIGKNVEAQYGIDQQLFFQSGGGQGRLLSGPGLIARPGDGVPRLSPDGGYVVLLFHVSVVPEDWREYQEAQVHEIALRQVAPGQYSWLCRYVLIDTTTGENKVLLDSPVKSWDTDVSWSPDRQSVVIANAYLPLNNAVGTERQVRQSKRFALEVDIQTGNIKRISDEDLRFRGWTNSGNDLIFEAGRWNPKSGPKIVFRRNGDRWERATLSARLNPRPEITIEEDMNTPPRFVVVDSNTHKRVLLLDLNPSFERLKFARVEEIHWTGSDGHRVKGGLYYPLHYEPGKRYPLVIQTHEWYPDRFFIDGPYSTAFAAQPLAGREIMVLQAEVFEDQDKDWWDKESDTPKEIERYVSDYEGAIDYLVAKGLVDRNHVGIIGFSRTCLYVKYALTHSRYLFAAASITDGLDGGYFQYIALNANVNLPMEFEGFNGGPPFGEGLESWTKRSPGFNLDKVRTPVRITAENPEAVLNEWEWFAGLRRLGKPVEMITMQDGLHELQKPWERMISLQGNVDWFTFWLKGEEDLDPGKAEQYGRWRVMRKPSADKP
jgi:dipeptidyl aminopeptidase/acylaminoacyl peptidase